MRHCVICRRRRQSHQMARTKDEKSSEEELWKCIGIKGRKKKMQSKKQEHKSGNKPFCRQFNHFSIRFSHPKIQHWKIQKNTHKRANEINENERKWHNFKSHIIRMHLANGEICHSLHVVSAEREVNFICYFDHFFFSLFLVAWIFRIVFESVFVFRGE